MTSNLFESESDHEEEEGEETRSMVTVHAINMEDSINERLAKTIRRINKYEEQFLTAKIQVARDEVDKAHAYLDALIAERDERLQLQVHGTSRSKNHSKRYIFGVLCWMVVLSFTMIHYAGILSGGAADLRSTSTQNLQPQPSAGKLAQQKMEDFLASFEAPPSSHSPPIGEGNKAK